MQLTLEIFTDPITILLDFRKFSLKLIHEITRLTSAVNFLLQSFKCFIKLFFYFRDLFIKGFFHKFLVLIQYFLSHLLILEFNFRILYLS